MAAVLGPTAAGACPTLEFEAWPTPATEICAAPCYQVRMFVEDQLGELQLQAFQMDVEVRVGAIPAILPMPPATNANADGGNIALHNPTGDVEFPWDIVSLVRMSPTVPGALILAASGDLLTVASLASVLNTPGTVCIDDPAKCALIADAIHRSRIYLGFFNVTQHEDLIGDGSGSGACPEPFLGRYCGVPPVGPYFMVQVHNVQGVVYVTPPSGQTLTGGDALAALLFNEAQPPIYYVSLLPEPTPALLLVGVLALLVPLRSMRTTVSRSTPPRTVPPGLP